MWWWFSCRYKSLASTIFFLILTAPCCLLGLAETWHQLPVACLDHDIWEPSCELCLASTRALAQTHSPGFPALANTRPPASCLDCGNSLQGEPYKLEWKDFQLPAPLNLSPKLVITTPRPASIGLDSSRLMQVQPCGSACLDAQVLEPLNLSTWLAYTTPRPLPVGLESGLLM